MSKQEEIYYHVPSLDMVEPLKVLAFKAVTPNPDDLIYHYIVKGINYDHSTLSQELIEALIQRDTVPVLFQSGPISEENQPNGVTIEALLAICKHRLEKFQQGKFASSYNEKALAGINDSLNALHQRTLDRIARDVEGKLEK